MASTPRPSRTDSEVSPEQLARVSIGFGIASIVTLLVPFVPIVLGFGALAASFLTRRARPAGEPKGLESNGIILGALGVALGVMMIGFYLYAWGKVQSN